MEQGSAGESVRYHDNSGSLRRKWFHEIIQNLQKLRPQSSSFKVNKSRCSKKLPQPTPCINPHTFINRYKFLLNETRSLKIIPGWL